MTLETIFSAAAAVAVASTAMAITRANAVHALLYLIVSLLAVAVVFFVLGAPFAAALQVIVYGGAMLVLFLVAVTTLELGEAAVARERRWLRPGVWAGPAILSAILLAEIVYVLAVGHIDIAVTDVVEARQVGIALLGPYLLAMELAAMLLLAGLAGAYHLGRRGRGEGG